MVESFITNIDSELDTIELAKEVAKIVKDTDVIALYGDLGSGKTFFTKHLAQSMGIDDLVSSPSFVLINNYQSGSKKLHHIDLYRLSDYDEVLSLGIEELIGDGLTVIEWPRLAEPLLPKETLKFTFNYSGSKRWVVLEDNSNRLSAMKKLKPTNG